MLSSIEKIYAALLDREYQQELFGELPLFQRKGTGYIACCPFHEDPLPTLLIYGDRPEYFCFACSERGDWLRYLKRSRSVCFLDAVATLSKASGNTLCKYSEDQWESDVLRTKILESAMESFITKLWSKPGVDVLHYLYTRGYATGEVEGMSLGFYPGVERTIQGLSELGFEEKILKATLSRFWTHTIDSPGLVIPFRDSSGRLMGLIHKDIKTSGPDSYNFLTDSTTLDGIPFLMYRSRTQKEIIVAEGYFDALLLDQVRLKPVISIGTGGFTQSQLETATHFGAKKFILALGNGERQKEVTRAAVSSIRKMGLTASVLPIPHKYKDLDEFIRMTCLDHFKVLLKKTMTLDKWLARKN
jgi:DNA primase